MVVALLVIVIIEWGERAWITRHPQVVLMIEGLLAHLALQVEGCLTIVAAVMDVAAASHETEAAMGCRDREQSTTNLISFI